jgi:hypothetical protein
MVQYNIAILGDHWSPMLMLYPLCGTWKLRGTRELHVGDVTHVLLLQGLVLLLLLTSVGREGKIKSRKGVSACVGEATFRSSRGTLT